ncbi:mitochondrial carrier domain-containing protein [Pelagophyceae sp. CCMP2097]|nr:mitochondrial carrier domain-containing protein [Pelagophyceae sp. CCMP2097]
MSSAGTLLPPIVCASFSTAAVMYPFDLVKALRMASPGADQSTSSLLRAFHRTYGARGFFTQGVAAEVARAGVMRCSKFWCFPLFFDAFYGRAPSSGTALERAVAGAACCIPEVLLIMPIEMAKVGLQLDAANLYGRSSRRVLDAVYQARGPAGLYTGFFGVQLRQSLWTAAYFGSLPTFEKAFAYAAPHTAERRPALAQLAAGFGAGVFGALVNVPPDVIRIHIQRDTLNQIQLAALGGAVAARPSAGFLGAAEFCRYGAAIARERGPRALWAGLSWKALHVGGSGALMAVFVPAADQFFTALRERSL